MAVITIGATAEDRGSTFSAGYTLIGLDGSATGTGTLAKFELWFASNGSEVKAGTFSGSGTDYTSRDVETIGAVTAGSKQTFSGLDCDVSTGDYAGIYFTGGTIETDTSGYAGAYYKGGDYFGAGQQTYSLFADCAISVYGEGETEAPPAGQPYSARVQGVQGMRTWGGF